MLKINLAQQIPVQAESDRANFKALQAWYRRALGVTVPEGELRQIFNTAPNGSVGAPRTPPGYTDALLAGMQRFTDLRAPVLAIFAIPADLGPWMNRDDAKMRDVVDAYRALAEKQARAFEMGVPTARGFPSPIPEIPRSPVRPHPPYRANYVPHRPGCEGPGCGCRRVRQR
jgi:hypothetical protein